MKALITSLFVLLLSCTALAQPAPEMFLIDFENFPDGTPVGAQYEYMGVWFAIAGSSVELPEIAIAGLPMTAFTGSGPDTPMVSGIGVLTDPVIGGNTNVGRDILIFFDPPVTSVRMNVIDIDLAEVFTLEAFDGPLTVDTDTHAAGESGTGNGVATEFFVSSPLITSVILDVPASVGFAVDYITFTRENGPGPRIEVAQESVPGLGDFDANILGAVVAYPTPLSAQAYYSYGTPEAASWNGQSLTPVADRSHLLFAETIDGMTLVVVHDRAIPDDLDGGRAEMRIELLGDPDGAIRTVEDDPGEFYTGAPGGVMFTSRQAWATCCTDGLALSGLDGYWTVILEFADVDGSSAAPIQGLIEWMVYSADGSLVPLALEAGRRVRLVRHVVPFVELDQPAGPLTPLYVNNLHLVDGHEYYNIVSFEPAPGGPGTGPYLGLHATNPGFLLSQFFVPVGSPPFHFIAPGPVLIHGPYLVPPGPILEAICIDITAWEVSGVTHCVLQ